MVKPFNLRPATLSDAYGIAQVNIQSWRETYPGIMPEARMASLNLDSCLANWQKSLAEENFTFVAEAEGKIIGFVCGGENRFCEGCETGLANKFDCELAAMYILEEYHKRGIGRKLVQAFALEMLKSKRQTMVVWVAKHNPATGFYARMGGERLDARDLIVTGEPVPLIAFRFELPKLFSLESLTFEVLKEYYEQ